MSEQLEAVRERLLNAALTMDALAEEYRSDPRLVGKAQGVRLALSYVEEELGRCATCGKS